MTNFCLGLCLGLAILATPFATTDRSVTIPATRGIALDGHAVTLPADLPGRASILILGFGRNSADATTAWEKQVQNTLASTPGIGYYDMPMLAEVPSMVRPLVLRSIRKQVPTQLHPNFVPLTSDLDAWKQVTGFTDTAPDAAYVLLVDRSGSVLWKTHDPITPTRFDELSQAARKIAATN